MVKAQPVQISVTAISAGNVAISAGNVADQLRRSACTGWSERDH